MCDVGFERLFNKGEPCPSLPQSPEDMPHDIGPEVDPHGGEEAVFPEKVRGENGDYSIEEN